MNAWELLFLFGSIFLTVFATLVGRKRWRSSLPGPWGLPFIGNLLQFDAFHHISYAKWANKYGPLIGINLASLKMAVISDPKLLKQAFNERSMSGRINLEGVDIAVDDNKIHGVIGSEGQSWETLRRFSVQKLNSIAAGKLETFVIDEVQELLDIFKDSEGSPNSHVREHLLFTVVNSLACLLDGRKYQRGDEALIEVTEKSDRILDIILESWGMLLIAPTWLNKTLFPNLSGYNKVREELKGLHTFFAPPIKQHVDTYLEDEQRDFVDSFITEIKKTSTTKGADSSSAFHGKFGENNMLATLADFYMAGTDTTTATLTWLVVFLANYPEQQKLFQDEIESITNNTRKCSLQDRNRMPYTKALISETLRFSSILPGGVQHKVMTDQNLAGYFIPKGTILTANLHYIHHDLKIWGDPENFRPNRFLSADGSEYVRHESLMPFSTGKRKCLGESLAQDIMFLTATGIFQRFIVESYNPLGKHSYSEPTKTLVMNPLPFSVIFKDRL